MKKPNPSAFLHVMHMDLGQKHRVPELTDTNPFGRPGRDYDPTYTVTCDPLYSAGQLLELVPGLEALSVATPVGTVIGFQLVNKVHAHPTVAWKVEQLPEGTELFTRPQQSAEVETLAELALARRYLEQALAALNPRAQLATNIRKLLDVGGRPKAAPKSGQLTEHGYLINTWETGVSAHDPVTGKTAEIDRRKYLSLSVATVAAIQNLKKMIDEV